jgi:hypothetical protein
VQGENWSREEVEATVAAYLAMLEQELRGLPFNKSEARRQLLPDLPGRSKGAIEWKHQNISAILHLLGLPSIRGYKPRSNYQGLLFDVVRARLLEAPTVMAAARERAEEPIAVPPEVDGSLLDRLVDRPDRPDASHGASMLSDRPRVLSIANYLEMEARNSRLGLAGESFVLRFESERLWRAGQKSLADRIEHVSRTRGDGDGYDVLSFEESGRERLIEVKTTTFGAYTPFFVTRNEVDVSAERAAQYYVYRLFQFRDDPKLFLVPGDISRAFSLEATEFIAR